MFQIVMDNYYLSGIAGFMFAGSHDWLIFFQVSAVSKEGTAAASRAKFASLKKATIIVRECPLQYCFVYISK